MSENWQKRAMAAETTADVLKRKVKALYNGEATSVFQRQLARAQHRQEEARRRRELMEVRAADLAKYNGVLEVQVAERTRALRTILDNVTSGFLLVDSELAVAAGYTVSCTALLGTTEIEGRDVATLFSGDESRLASHLRLALHQVFADMLPEEVSLDAIPKRFVVGERPLRVDARAIRAEDSTVTQILLTVNDITALENAQREARENRVLIGILRQRETFREFVADTRELLVAARDAVQEGDQAFYRRALHTVKGNGAAFDLVDLVHSIHAIESKPEITAADIDGAEAELREFLARNSRILELPFDAPLDASFSVSEGRVEVLTAMTRAQDVDIRRWTAELVLKRTDVVLGPLHTYVEKLAERLEKRVTFILKGGDVPVDVRRLRPIVRNLSHLLRNAVDHGIELPDDRGEKVADGTLEIRMEDAGRSWKLHVLDDGRGIDTDVLVARAVEQGRMSPEGANGLTPEERVGLIFVDGLSTAREATEVSGRGVGMAAVKAAVQDAGGTISVDSVLGRGTHIIITVPKPDALSSLAPPSTRSNPPRAYLKVSGGN